MTATNGYRRIVFTLLFVLLAGPLLAVPALAQDTTPIAEARDQGVGATVTVEGTVTRAFGAFVRLQDDSGPTGTSALAIRQADGPQSESFQNAIDSGNIQPGTRLRVTGTLGAFYGLLQINGADLSSYEIIGQGAPPAPQEVTLNELIWNGEDYESELIRVGALRLPGASGTFENELGYDAVGPSGTTVTLRVQDASETALGGTSVPDAPFAYEGILGQFNGAGPSSDEPDIGYQLIPVRASDLDTGAQSVALRDGYALAYETGGEATATVRVSAFGLDGSENVTLSVSEAGSAAAGDVSGLSNAQTFTLSAGETETLSVTVQSDGEAEGIERLELALSSDNGLATGGRFTLWILDDPAAQATLYAGLEGQALREQLRADFASTADGTPGPPILGYSRARDTLYATVFNDGGTVRGIYTGFETMLTGGDPSEDVGDQGINTEHVWPRSQGPEREPALSNMHILAPARAPVNTARSNYPFSEIPDAETDQWYFEDQSQTSTPSSNLDAWSELDSSPSNRDARRFEPRHQVKGEVARKMFYFALAYPNRANFAFFNEQRATLQQWHDQDPVDATEQRRNVLIASSQGDELNPFQLDPTLAARAFGEDAGGTPSEPISIAEARQTANGATVTVEGIFTRIEGSNARIQDQSGPTGASGLVVRADSLADAIASADVQAGDRLRATGTLGEYANLKQISEDNGEVTFEVIEQDAGVPAAQNVSLAEIAANGEDYESELVRVEGLTIDAGGDETFAAGGSAGNYTATGPNGNSITLRIPSGSFYEGEPIPESEVTFEGVAGQFNFDAPDSGYQLLAIEAGALTDTGGSGETLAVNISRSFGDPDASTGYRLVALPGSVNRPLASTIDGANGSAWQAYWDNGSDTDFFIKWDDSETFNFRPGRGFWLIAENAWQVEASLPAVQPASDGSYTIDLHASWNIISNPLAEGVAWSAVEAANGGTLQPLWRFSGSYAQAETFASAQANGEAFYFLNSEGLNELVIPAPGASPAAVARASSGDTGGTEDHVLTLSTYRDGQRTSTARLGTASGATDGLDAHDAFAPPGRFEAASLRLRLPDGAASGGNRQQWLAGERRAPGADGYAFDLVLQAAPGGAPVTLRTGGLSAFAGQKVLLVEPSTGRTHDLRAERTVEITPSGDATDLRLLIGSAAVAAAGPGLPDEVTLRPGYPNPFRGNVTLEYALPEAANVRLAVYDLLGRRVRTLTDGRQPAGQHTIKWDGEGASGAPLASGVYFVRLTAGGVTRSQKLVRVQ